MNLETFTKLDFNFSPGRLMLNMAVLAEAKQLMYSQAKILAIWAAKFGCKEFIINFLDCENNPYQIPASIAANYIYEDIMTNLIIMPGIQIAEMKLSLPILRVNGYVFRISRAQIRIN